MCVCVGESEYLQLKVFLWVWVCVFAGWKKNSIHLFALCANYSYLSNSRHTLACVCVCFFIYMCVLVYQGTAWLFHISNSLCNTKDEAQPNMIAFNVSHKSLSCVCMCVCVCACVWGGEGCFCTRSKQRFKSLTPLIKASHYNTNKQSKRIHTSIC